MEGEGFLAAVLDSSDDAIFGIDVDRSLTRWNRGARRLYGYEESEIRGKRAAHLFAEHRRVEGEALIERALHGERVERAETDARRTDGLVIPVWMTLTPLIAQSGNGVTGLVAVVRDVSEQKLAAATLAESEERLRESEVLANTGAWLWDGQDLVQWSDGMYRIHGLEPAAFNGTLDSHFAHVRAEDRAAALSQLREAFDAAGSFETEYRLTRADGADVWVYVRGQPIVDALERPQGMTGIYQDVSDLRRAEQDRRLLSEAQLRQMQAREINDEIVQRLVVAQLAFELGEHARAHDALEGTLATARRLVTGLLGDGPVLPGSLRRSASATSN
ncbi:MAG: PAS domain S-box protein [Acidimicrobiia bacterium]|nr:PAS domain S-box protein [Acidimicrobiia bacterium]